MYGDAYDARLADVIHGLIQHDPDVVNLSLGPTPADRPGEKDEGTARTVAALAELQARRGTIVVVAAGTIDEEAPAEQLAPPGPLSLIVGALDLSGQPAWFSGVKPVTIWAPGVDILSSFVHFAGPVSLAHPGEHHPDGHHGRDGAEPPGPSERPLAPFTGWARWNGTSFAAPAVSGALAAEISALAAADPKRDRRELRRQAVERVLDRARPLADGAPAMESGGAVTGVAVSALPVALMGPPATEPAAGPDAQVQ